MKINGNELRPGYVIHHKGSLWRVVKTQHVKPGKGGAFAQAELKEIPKGTKLNERFRSAETVERARLESRRCQCLFREGDAMTLMDMETYDQFSAPTSLAGDALAFLADGMEVSVEMCEGVAIAASLPEHVEATVAESEPAIKGQTATSSYKPVVLDNGVKTSAPPFVDVGDRIVVATADASYVRRAD